LHGAVILENQPPDKPQCKPKKIKAQPVIEIANLPRFWHTKAPMKKLSAIFALVTLAAGVRAALPQPDLIAQIHFAGAQKISAGANPAAFTNEFCSAEALALRAQTADKLSAWLAGWLQKNLNVTVPDGAAKLRPLFDDLQTSEWFLESRSAADGRVEAAIAIQLDDARAQTWRASLKPFFAAAAFKSAGGWLIFDSGTGAQKLGDNLAQRISASPASWLDLDVNWPRLAQWYPELKALGLPETVFSMTAPDSNFLINGKFLFPENLSLNLENWRVPTNTLHQPFNSFTAVRGIAAWFQSQAWAQPFQLTPAPDQLFVWSLPQNPFQTFAAIPVPDSAAALAQSYARLQPALTAADASNYFALPVTVEPTNNEIRWRGMPFVSPDLRSVREPAGQFLFWETFPNTPRSRPLPPELFQQLAMKNLVFYHWEVTAERVPQLMNLGQFSLMITSHKQLVAGTPGFKWLQKTAATPGTSATEITQSGPAELTFARKAPGVFTAVELFALANWLEAANFPGCDLKLPPRSLLLRRLHQQQMSSPLPATPPAH